MRFVHERFALRPALLFTVLAVTFAAVLFVAQAAPAAAQTATVTRPAGTAVATGVATRAQGVGAAVATRAATTAATASRRSARTRGSCVSSMGSFACVARMPANSKSQLSINSANQRQQSSPQTRSASSRKRCITRSKLAELIEFVWEE